MKEVKFYSYVYHATLESDPNVRVEYRNYDHNVRPTVREYDPKPIPRGFMPPDYKVLWERPATIEETVLFVEGLPNALRNPKHSLDRVDPKAMAEDLIEHVRTELQNIPYLSGLERVETVERSMRKEGLLLAKGG